MQAASKESYISKRTVELYEKELPGYKVRRAEKLKEAKEKKVQEELLKSQQAKEPKQEEDNLEPQQIQVQP
jgi:predicted SPOUT superfamily RNA methylase MTH1